MVLHRGIDPIVEREPQERHPSLLVCLFLVLYCIFVWWVLIQVLPEFLQKLPLVFQILLEQFKSKLP